MSDDPIEMVRVEPGTGCTCHRHAHDAIVVVYGLNLTADRLCRATVTRLYEECDRVLREREALACVLEAIDQHQFEIVWAIGKAPFVRDKRTGAEMPQDLPEVRTALANSGLNFAAL